MMTRALRLFPPTERLIPDSYKYWQGYVPGVAISPNINRRYIWSVGLQQNLLRSSNVKSGSSWDVG